MDDKNRFLDFPIALLKGFLNNPDEVLSNVYCYAVFKMVYSEDKVFDTFEDFSSNYKSQPNQTFIIKIQTQGEVLYNSFAGYKHVWTGIHIDTFRKFFQKQRSEFDLVCLLAFLALKSISQKARFKKNVPNDFLMSRMSGFGNKVSNDLIDPTIMEYMHNKSKKKRHVFDALEESFGVVRTEKSRGITYSLVMSRMELELMIMKGKYLKSDEYKVEEKRREKERARIEFEKWKQSEMK